MLCIRVLSCNIHVYRFSFHTIINPPASIQNSTYSKRVTQFPTPILIDRDHPLTHPHVTTQTTSELVRADPQWGSTQPISNPHLRLSSTPTPTTPRQQPLRQLPPTTSQDDSRVRLVLGPASKSISICAGHLRHSANIFNLQVRQGLPRMVCSTPDPTPSKRTDQRMMREMEFPQRNIVWRKESRTGQFVLIRSIFSRVCSHRAGLIRKYGVCQLQPRD